MPGLSWMPLPKALSRAADAQGNVWDSSAGEWVPSTSCGRDLEERAAANRERSARRAKTQVRRLIKAKNLDTMLTLTYRENMTDRARMARDFDVFMKRIRRIFPSFEYVCVFEEQKRGVHGTLIWLSACSKSLSAPWGAGEVLRPSEGCLAGCGG